MSQTNTSDALSYIARTFAEAYYGLLVDAENLSKLHIFYQLDAVFTRGDEALGPQGASTTTGLEGIKKELAAFHNQVRNSEVTLKVLDSQYSVNQGIIITAIGSFNRVEGATVKTRRFVQTFFLEAQTPHNYTIRNDSLRYLQETSPQVAVAPQPEPKPQPVATPAPTPSTNGTADTHSATAVPAADSNGEAKKQPQEKKKPAIVAGSPTAARKGQGRQPRKTEDKKGKPEQGQEQPAAKPSKPATYANIVSGSAVPTSAPPAAEQPKPKTGAAAPKQQTQPQQAQQQQQQQQQPKPVKEKKPKQEREGHSVYVGNLPFEATSEQVYNLFAKFGSIKDIALKRGYGFVDLASAEDLKKVVDHFTAHPAELDGRPLVIEDRKRGAPKTTNAPRPAQGQSQPKPAGAKRPTKTGGKPADNTAH